MILYVEQLTGDEFTGRAQYPTLANAITSIEGKIVRDFGDDGERSRWKYVKDFDTDTSGVWLTFTETKLIQLQGSSNIGLFGWYYARTKKDAPMIGAYFYRKTDSAPLGDFVLSASP